MKKQIALGILGLMSLSLAGCGTRMSVYADADKYLAGNQTYEEAITDLDIDWISGSVILVEDATITGVKLEEVTDLTNEKELVHSYLNNGKLMIKFFASGHYCTKLTGYKKELTVTYHPGLANVNIDITSGSLSAESITATKVNIDMTSGSAKVNKVIAEDIDIDLTSGSIEMNNITTNTFDADLTSGTITSGFTLVNNADYDLTSGKINLTLPIDGGSVKVSKTSGKVNTERECIVNQNTYTFGTGAANFKVSMTSGTLNIK